MERGAIDAEIKIFLDMTVITEFKHDPNEFISPISLVKKKNSEYRMIIYLKELNESIVYHHFKMDTFESTLKLIIPDYLLAVIDIRHAYRSVFMAEKRSGRLYQYLVLPNGISCAPRIFTKLMKPAYASLRLLGHSNSGFIDESLMVSDTLIECSRNVEDTVALTTDVGFITHKKKSVYVPTKKVTFLRNDIDSEKMIVTLPSEEVNVITEKNVCLYTEKNILASEL